MKVLITGATGFVGSHMSEYLLENFVGEKLEVFLTTRFNSNLKNISNIILKKNVYVEYLELTDPESCNHIINKINPDQIYHFGAYTWVTPSWTMPTIYFDVNALGTINLLEAVRKYSANSKVLISCSPEEYGNVSENNLPITELTPLHPINPYAASKVSQEMVALTWEASYGLEIIRTRVFNHEGARRLPLGANSSFAYQIAKIEAGIQEPVLNVGNLEALRNFTAISDVIEAYYIAMNKGNPGELYLIGNETTYTMRQSLEMLLSLSSCRNIEIRQIKNLVRPTELKNFTGNFSKFYALSGWRPKKELREILSDVLDYWRKRVRNGDLYI